MSVVFDKYTRRITKAITMKIANIKYILYNWTRKYR